MSTIDRGARGDCALCGSQDVRVRREADDRRTTCVDEFACYWASTQPRITGRSALEPAPRTRVPSIRRRRRVH